MKRIKRKTIITTLLAAACIGITLSGCAADEKNADNQNVEQNTPAADYEQFLNNNIPATYNNNDTENDYLDAIFENGNSYTFAELGECVSKYYERWDKSSYDTVQYAYVECPDSADANARNLLVKFIGLNIYSSDDDSYAVFVITENNGQLYVTDTYECWARSETTAYTNGTLISYGSGGAALHYDELSVILSNGKQTPIYSAEIHSEESGLVVFIYTIGDEKYYLCDTSDCTEEEKVQYEGGKADMSWSTEEEIQAAIQNQCNTIGIDYSITKPQEKAVWNDK